MSSVIIAGNTSGSVTLAAPDVAGTTTLTLPATSGTFLTTTGGVAPGTSGNVLTSNGTTWTSAAIPSSAPTTEQVLTATAGASIGAIGTYVMAGTVSAGGVSIPPGNTVAGSSLVYFGLLNNNSSQGWSNVIQGVSGNGSSTTLSGTWRAMGNGATVSLWGGTATLFLRIS